MLKERKIKNAVLPYALIAPSLVLLGIFVYGVANGVLQGFGIMPFLGMDEFTFAYYEQALSRADFMASLGFSLYISLIASVCAVVGGIVLSAALVRLKGARALHLLAVSVPLMTAHMLVTLFAVSLFAGSGLVPRFLQALGQLVGVGAFPSIVGDASGWGIMFVYVWKEVPFVAFCTLAIMGQVSQRYGEAALTLGASPVRAFFNVTLPLCKGALVKAFLIVFAFAFGSYEVPFLLGPTLPKALPVLAYMEFQNPDILNRCYAMAIDGVMVAICSVLAVAYFLVLQREKEQ